MKIGIIGTGLIGGSLALALKKSPKYKIYCYNRRVETSKKAIKLKAVDKYFESIDELAGNSDVIIIATPLGTYADISKKLAPHLNGKKIISDVGSVKSVPTQQVLKIIPAKYKSFFVPAHPIAGKEKGGLENASANLFKGKKLIICKTANCKKGKITAQLWKDVGAEIELLNANKHDEIYAFVSHYVQLLSFACAKHLGKNLGEFSRLMNSPKDIWDEIFLFNRTNLKKVNDKFLISLLRKLRYIKQYKGANEFEVAAKIIVDSYIETVPSDYRKYGGSGYKSFTSILSSGNKNAKEADVKKVSAIITKIYNDLKKTKL
jgi:prephenate dehydrogenase